MPPSPLWPVTVTWVNPASRVRRWDRPGSTMSCNLALRSAGPAGTCFVQIDRASPQPSQHGERLRSLVGPRSRRVMIADPMHGAIINA
jgi:hypothetical protein